MKQKMGNKVVIWDIKTEVNSSLKSICGLSELYYSEDSFPTGNFVLLHQNAVYGAPLSLAGI